MQDKKTDSMFLESKLQNIESNHKDSIKKHNFIESRFYKVFFKQGF
ncbi:hypothetical protein DCO58_11705 [Helicobacter saguini]|uniref:Uncharacterized protein n=1 Tax=Helicobacter saguini TaxID=1548018 RepID=A0A6B0HW19_9HELI|nr:hypothetical protein [Helicobacter saguini]MWV61045.1 hypothetical protein [Helicobacter saguini]MWV68286.1 hypothetical protein [Helicobacter saguini]MWV70249.1 hypothetical protein [Helicobacter saguini]MWV72152.1 hypothetical protein [Helicobacter saguini]